MRNHPPLQEIAPHGAEVLRSRNLHAVCTDFSETGFGDAIWQFRTNDSEFRLVRDRGQFSLEIRARNRGWLSGIRSLLNGDPGWRDLRAFCADREIGRGYVQAFPDDASLAAALKRVLAEELQ